MESQLLLSYLLEFAMLFPLVFMTIAPTKNALCYRASVVYAVTAGCVALLVVIGATIALSFGLLTDAIVLIECLVLFALFWRASSLSSSKKLYCFLNAVMVCSFVVMYSNYVTAPWEVDNMSDVFTPRSAGVRLLIALALCVVFSRTLLVKLPSLFAQESLNSQWKWYALALLVIIGLFIWLIPESVSNVMIAYIRLKSVIIMILIPIAIWVLYHIMWLTAKNVSEGDQLKRENEVLRLEEKRHAELMSYVDDARRVRHDYRHHMIAVSELVQSGKTEEAIEYADQFIDETAKSHASYSYCENKAVDAIAAHFDWIARERGIKVVWILDTPEELPVNIVDFCSVLSNLVENAINATDAYDGDSKTIEVKAKVFANDVVTITVENPYVGGLMLDRRGLPISQLEGHGIGLTSVDAIARKCNGNLTIAAENSKFSAAVVLYSSKA